MVKVNTQHLCLAVCVLTLVLVVVLVVRQNSSREQMGSNPGACMAKERMRKRIGEIENLMRNPSIPPNQRNSLAKQKDLVENNLINVLRACPDN